MFESTLLHPEMFFDDLLRPPAMESAETFHETFDHQTSSKMLFFIYFFTSLAVIVGFLTKKNMAAVSKIGKDATFYLTEKKKSLIDL